MRTLLLSLLAVGVLAPAALAGPNVPEVAAGRLPVAGTCAPLPSANITWVTVGESGWFRVDVDPQDLQTPGLTAALRDRAQAAGRAGQAHDVWIVADGSREWGQVINVLMICQQVGLHRVGLQVRSPEDGATYGFPLFLPYPSSDSTPSGSPPSGRRLDVRLEATGRSPSDPVRLYAAALAAVEKFAPVVAEVSISVRTTIQDAVTAIDMLYRAGCASVRVKYRMMVRSMTGPSVPEIWVEERLLPSERLPLELPPIRPRKAPWPDDGAAQPGAHQLVLVPIPSPGETPSRDESFRQPLPSYAARGGEVPPAALAEAQTALIEWSGVLGGWLERILTQTRVNVPETLLVKRRRQGLGAEQMFGDARAAFATAGRVTPATIRVQAYLFQGPKIVGKVDTTLNTAGDALNVIFANWVVEDFPSDLTLPPVETEPFAAGVPGLLRVWIEGMLAAARARGVGAIPLSSEAEVLAELPPVAHAGVRSAIARRLPAFEALVGWLRATPYDRVFLAVVDGQAGVHALDGQVAGVLRYDLEGEAGNLSLATLTAKVAPR